MCLLISRGNEPMGLYVGIMSPPHIGGRYTVFASDPLRRPRRRRRRRRRRRPEELVYSIS